MILSNTPYFDFLVVKSSAEGLKGGVCVLGGQKKNKKPTDEIKQLSVELIISLLGLFQHR